jgi:zinc D-Ala-D-Ala carboxypeptidase
VKLSKNFNQKEFACNCCGIATVDMRLVNALEQLRALLKKPISITSGYRCKKHNAEVGGARSSKHATGQAADVVIKGVTLKQIVDKLALIREFDKGGIGVYPVDTVNGPQAFVHVDVGREKPGRWARVDGKYVALMEGLDREAANQARQKPRT